MGKIFKRFLIVLIIFVLISIGGVIWFLKTVDINRFKPYLTQELSTALGREVTIEQIKLNFLFLGTSVIHLYGLEIRDLPPYQQEQFASIGHAQAEVHMADLLSQLKSWQEGQANQDPQAMPQSSSDNLKPSLVRALKVSQGRIIIRELQKTLGIPLVVDGLELDVRNFSLKEAFDIELHAAVFDTQRNVHVRGKSRIDLKGPQVRLDDVRVNADFSRISLSSLGDLIQPLQEWLSSDKIPSRLEGDIRQAVVSPEGLLLLAMTGNLIVEKIPLKEGLMPLQDLKAEFQASEKDLIISKMSMQSPPMGTIIISGDVIDYLKRQQYSASAQISHLKVSYPLKDIDPQAKFVGAVNVSSTVKGEGLANPETMQTVSGEMKLDIQEARLEKFNVLQFVFKKISMIPDLVGRLQAALPQEYQEMLNREHTPFQKIETHAVIHEGTASLDVIDVVADVFEIRGQGTIDWQQNADLTFTIEIPQELSQSMIKAVEELQFFADNSGKISIPLERYEGPISAYRPFPDLEKLGRQFIQTKGKEEIKKLLDKVLDREDADPAQTDPAATGQPPSGGPQKRPEEQILDNILDGIWN